MLFLDGQFTPRGEYLSSRSDSREYFSSQLVSSSSGEFTFVK